MRTAKRINKIRINTHLFRYWYFGMDFYVVLKRDGKEVMQTKCRKSNISQKQKIAKEEAMEWFQSEYRRTLPK